MCIRDSVNGGVKIEVGEDANADGILDTDEVDDSLTRYVCNGADGEGGSGSEIGVGGCNFKTVTVVEAPEDGMYFSEGINTTGNSNFQLWGTQLAVDVGTAWYNDSANVRYENYPGGISDGQNLILEYEALNANELLFRFDNVFGDWGYNTLVGVRAYDSSNNLVPFYYEHSFDGYEESSATGIQFADVRSGKLVGNSDGNFQWIPRKFHGMDDEVNVGLKIVSQTEIERIEVEFDKADQSAVPNNTTGRASFYGGLYIWKFSCDLSSSGGSASGSGSEIGTIGGASAFMSLEPVDAGISSLSVVDGMAPDVQLIPSDNYTYIITPYDRPSMNSNLGLGSWYNEQNQALIPHWIKFRINGLQLEPDKRLLFKLYQGNTGGEYRQSRILTPEIIDGNVYFYVYTQQDLFSQYSAVDINNYPIPELSSLKVSDHSANLIKQLYELEVYYETEGGYVNSGLIFTFYYFSQ